MALSGCPANPDGVMVKFSPSRVNVKLAAVTDEATATVRIPNIIFSVFMFSSSR